MKGNREVLYLQRQDEIFAKPNNSCHPKEESGFF